jgi:hypothetical protein
LRICLWQPPRLPTREATKSLAPMLKKSIIAEQRQYRVKVVDDAKEIAFQYLENIELSQALKFGLPEVAEDLFCLKSIRNISKR